MGAAWDQFPHLTPEQQERVSRSLERVARIRDGLGHRVDPGIALAVGMLNELGVTTSASCEGHVGWATGGPYIDVVSPQYWDMKPKHREMKKNPELEEQADILRDEIKLANAVEGRKLLPILNDFYQNRTASYETRLGLTFYGDAITRIESVGVAFLDAEPDSGVRVRLLRDFQAEMRAFSDFLVSYEPAGAPFLNNLAQKLSERGAGSTEGKEPLPTELKGAVP